MLSPQTILQKFKSLVIMLSLVGSACVKEKIVEVPVDNKPNENTKIEITVNDQKTAEELAQAAEQLIATLNFPLAESALKMALEKDPNNQRAQFHSAFLDIYLQSRGMLNRIKPVVRLHGSIAHHEEMIKGIPNSPLKNFLLDGPEDIKTISDVQAHLANSRDAINRFRKYLKANLEKFGTMSIYLNPHSFRDTLVENYRNSCVIKDNNPVVEQPGRPSPDRSSPNVIVVCDVQEVAIVKVNLADLAALAQIAAGQVLWMSLYTSYSTGEIDRLLLDLKKESEWHDHTAEEIQTRLEAVESYGKLAKFQSFSIVKELGADFAAAAKWALQQQKRLCAKGSSDKSNRPGYLFSTGICIDNPNQAQKDLAQLNLLLSGVVDWTFDEPRPYRTSFDALALFNNPAPDLRTLSPGAWSSCGTAASLRDPTLNGVFPRGDAEILLIDKNTCRSSY